MSEQNLVFIPLGERIAQIRVPTPTLPPSFETNTYVIGRKGGETLLVDFGSDDTRMGDELIHFLNTHGLAHVIGIVATHYHRDHTQGIPLLQRVLSCPVYVHALDIKNACREMKVQDDATWIRPLPQAIHVDDLDVNIIHTPGHTHGHVSLAIETEKVVLVGDLLAGVGSVWVGPPDGHMGDYIQSLERIARLGYPVSGPGHGPAIEDTPSAAPALIARRKQRESEFMEHIANGVCSLDMLVQTAYGGNVAPGAMWVARKTVQGHLAHLIERGKIQRLYDEANGRFVYKVLETP